MLERAVGELAAEANAIAARLSVLGRLLQVSDAPRELGCMSATGVIVAAARMDPGHARRVVALGAMAAKVPRAEAVWQRGGVSAAHVEAVAAAVGRIARAAPGLDAGALAVIEEELVGVAVAGTPAQVRRRGRELLLVLCPEMLPEAEDASRNRLFARVGADGRGRIRGDLDAETTAKLLAALEQLSAPVPGPDGERDPRSAEERRAEALGGVLEVYLRSGRAPRDAGVRPHITLTAQARDLAQAGLAPLDLDDHADLAPQVAELIEKWRAWPFQLGWLGPVSAGFVRRISCDAGLAAAVVDGEGVPLNLGREERLASPHQRRALALRDGGCAFPGCWHPPSRCEAHHIEHWSRGGRTDLGNLVLLCGAHHRLLHHSGWEVFIGGDGHPWFTPPPTVDAQRRHRRSNNRRHLDKPAA